MPLPQELDNTFPSSVKDNIAKFIDNEIKQNEMVYRDCGKGYLITNDEKQRAAALEALGQVAALEKVKAYLRIKK